MDLSRAWRLHEARRIERCRRGGAATELLGAVLLLPASVFVLWRSIAFEPECGTSPLGVASGVMLFALGWSSLGRAYWMRLVGKVLAPPVGSDRDFR